MNLALFTVTSLGSLHTQQLDCIVYLQIKHYISDFFFLSNIGNVQYSIYYLFYVTLAPDWIVVLADLGKGG